MKSYLRVVFLLMSLAASVNAGTFLLVDTTHTNLYGPFEYEDKSTIQIGDVSMILKILTRDETPAERLAKSIVIPSLEFRNAALVDVIDYLREASNASGINQPNINIILKAREFSLPINLNLRRVSLADALRYIAEVNGLELRWDENAAVISVIEKYEDVEHVPPGGRGEAPRP